MRTRTSNALFVALAAVLAYAALHLTWAVHQLRDLGDQLRAEHLAPDERVSPMNYSKVEFFDGEGTLIATYTGVTNYTDHENYVSFTGTKVGGDDGEVDYEINRSTFGSVTKTPNPV